MRGQVPIARRALSGLAIWSTLAYRTPLAAAGESRGSWPSFRGPQASGVADGQDLPDTWSIATGEDVYRQRLPEIGSGYSASPVAADGKIYLSSEDGEMLVVAAGSPFRHIATNSMGEPIMATAALSEGVIYVRTSRTLFAIGRTTRS